MKKVLIIEDDPDLVGLISIHLSDMDCLTDHASEGPHGLDKAQDPSYDLIVLDIMLPGMDGLEICRRLRAQNIRTPILMLTARAEEIDTVLGLEMGADDYMTKPFSVREFIARVKAIFRRTELWERSRTEDRAAVVLRHGGLEIDLDKRRVSMNNARIDLSPKEFDLLSLLAQSPGKSYDRAKILDLVWGYEFEGYEHTVNSHINRLRNKIEPDAANPRYILTTWGVGYRLNEDL